MIYDCESVILSSLTDIALIDVFKTNINDDEKQ
jgi:hypothetical protein